ncbi:MAG TPA: ATP synthase F1 subunit epsilon [Candidatus Dormibacteraeota bacterium]|nr:ATP synthase F1 subunit epsilon [Candidatus Dormibacteraeota bacterium]
MATEFQLRIVTPTRAVVDQSVSEVTAPGTLGEFGVLPDHANFLTSLDSGRLTYKDPAGAHILAVRDGFAEVSDNVMTVLAEAAEGPAEVNVNTARADLQAAEAELAQLAPVDPEFPAVDAKRRWAQARLDVAK